MPKKQNFYLLNDEDEFMKKLQQQFKKKLWIS